MTAQLVTLLKSVPRCFSFLYLYCLLKDDFQSVRRNLESSLAFSQMQTFRNYLHDAKRSKFYASFFCISLDETPSQLQKSMKLLLEKEFERPQGEGMWLVTNNIDSNSIE